MKETGIFLPVGTGESVCFYLYHSKVTWQVFRKTFLHLNSKFRSDLGTMDMPHLIPIIRNAHAPVNQAQVNLVQRNLISRACVPLDQRSGNSTAVG
jgi:hypothetical protein